MKNFAQTSTGELLRIASSDADDEQVWDAILELHRRGGDDAYRGALQLVQSARPRERTAGANILAQIGYSDRERHEPERTDALIAMLKDEDAEVVAAAATALGHVPHKSRAILPLVAHVSHSSSQVRFGVASALAGIDDRQATDALIQLSHDGDPDVRDWATFGLGSMCSSDYPELRAALAERLTDEDADVAMEAVAGLAERKDPRALTVLRGLLDNNATEIMAGHLDACASLADPSLLPGLLRLRADVQADDAYWISCLGKAIAACEIPR